MYTVWTLVFRRVPRTLYLACHCNLICAASNAIVFLVVNLKYWNSKRQQPNLNQLRIFLERLTKTVQNWYSCRRWVLIIWPRFPVPILHIGYNFNSIMEILLTLFFSLTNTLLLEYLFFHRQLLHVVFRWVHCPFFQDRFEFFFNDYTDGC